MRVELRENAEQPVGALGVVAVEHDAVFKRLAHNERGQHGKAGFGLSLFNAERLKNLQTLSCFHKVSFKKAVTPKENMRVLHEIAV